MTAADHPADTAADQRDDHGEWELLAVGWALSALEPRDESRFAAHLGGCDRCAEAVAAADRTLADLAAGVPAEEPPPALRERLVAAVAIEPQQPQPPLPAAQPWLPAQPARAGAQRSAAAAGPAGRPPGPGRPGEGSPEDTGQGAGPGAATPLPARDDRRRPPRWAAVAAAAAGLALLAALLGWNLALRADRDELRDVVAQRDAVIAELTRSGPARVAALAPPTGGGPRVVTVVVRAGGVDVISEGLSPNDAAATAYWLWSLTGPSDDSPVPIAGFDVASRRLSVQTVGSTESGLGRVPIFAVSREPGRGRPAAPTEVVALGEVIG